MTTAAEKSSEPREETTVAVATRLEKELRDALALKAEENDRTLSAEMRRAIRFYLGVAA